MSITNNCKGVWVLDDTYKKINSDLWVNYVAVSDTNAYGTLWAWGDNCCGSFGNGNIGGSATSSPIQIPGSCWSKTAVGYFSSFFTRCDGTLWATGFNDNGRLGANNLTNYSSPIQIPGTTWCLIRSGKSDTVDTSTLALKTDGTLWTWGWNNCGQLGTNNLTCHSSPVQIPGTQWNNASVAGRVAAATKTDGTLWVWGLNQQGALGTGNTINYSSPIQIPGTQWLNIDVSSISAVPCGMVIATKTNNTLWTWGSNASGNLGQNDRVHRSSPTQVPGTSWYKISSLADKSMVTKTDGTLWVWGCNNNGQLGIGNITTQSSPTQIPGTSWLEISSGACWGHSIKTDGTMWAWGRSTFAGGKGGYLGNNENNDYSSPIQIPGEWYRVCSSFNHILAVKA